MQFNYFINFSVTIAFLSAYGYIARTVLVLNPSFWLNTTFLWMLISITLILVKHNEFDLVKFVRDTTKKFIPEKTSKEKSDSQEGTNS